LSFQPSPPDPSPEASERSERLRRQRFIQIPGYEIEYEIGRGGMATVYRAVQQSLSRQVALKVLARQTDDDNEFVQRFKKEGQILARLLHPNIVTIYDVGISEDNQLFLSIEYLSGGTLGEKIKQGLSFDSTIQIARAITKALGYAHERGIIHRDVKPSNIMFRHDGAPVLTDFGVARIVESKTVHTVAGLTVGSPGYMSPEQAMGEAVTIQSDLYSLGVVVYEMLAGRRLYEAENPIAIALKHLYDPIPDLPKQYADFQPVLNKLLAKKTSDRYKSADEFLQALELIAPSNTGTQPKLSTDIISKISLVEVATGKVRNLVKQKSRFPVIIFGVVVLLIAGFYIFKKMSDSVKQAQISELASPGPDAQTPRSSEVAMLLKLAETQLKAGLLTAASGEDNAEATYQRVLTLDPGNSRARAGLETVAGEYEKRARQKLDAGALQDSLEQIKRGLAAAPKQAELLRLRQEVERRIAELNAKKAREEEQQQDQLQAEQFLAQAKTGFDEGLLEVSLAHIEQGLLTAPGHPGLLALREQVKARMVERQRRAEAEQQQRDEEARRQAEEVERRKAEQARQQAEAERRRQQAEQYLAQAVESQRNENYDASRQFIEKGLQAVPNHAELLRLQEEVRAQIATEQQRQAEQARREQDIKALLKQAEAHWKAKRLTEPAGNNAEATYREVLKLDSSNAQARTGLERIAQEYWQQAQQRRAKGVLQDSLELIDKGLAVVPNQGDLTRLREDVTREMAEAKAQQEQEARQRLLAEQSLAQARTSFKEGALEASLTQIEQGLLAAPKHPDLLNLREQVKARIAEQARQQAELAKRQQEEAARRQAEETERQKAEQARQQAELVKRQQEEAARRQAEETERQKAEQARQQAELAKRQQEEAARRQAEETERQKAEQARQQAELAKRQQEADQLLARAVEAQQKGELAASVQQIEQGLALMPKHSELSRLRETVRAQLAAEQQRQKEQAKREQEIKTWLEQAESHWKAKRLTSPPVKNAEAAYRQVLKLDAGNTQAQAGLERIAQEYLQQAQQRRSAGALQNSLELIDKGLAVVPNQAELLRLREEVRAEWSAEQQRREQQQKEQQQKLEQQKEQQQKEQQQKEQQRKLEQQKEQPRLEQQQEQQRQEQQRRLEQQRKLEQQKEQQRLEQQRKLEQQKEQQRLEQQRKLEQKDQQRLEQQKEQQRQEQQRKEQQRLEQQRLEQQRKEQQRLEQQRLEQQRQDRQRQERQPPPPQPEPAKPRIFGTF